MSYTVGNWTVESLTTDSISTAKSLSIVDLDYASDFSVTKRGTDITEIANLTSTGLQPAEHIRYGRSRVKDVYDTFSDVPSIQRSNITEGAQTLVELRYLLKATNSVSGEEILLPMKGWLCLRVPVMDLVSTQALTDLLKRTISAAFATGSTDGSLITKVVRGDLDPTL